ncbi:MAG: hypothetical protein ACOYY3_12355 [Chloroflexota bacterium]
MEEKEFVSIPVLSGVNGNASVTFVNATFQKVDEVSRRYPDPDFGAWLFEEIYTKRGTLAERRGVLKKKFLCSSCGTVLNPEMQMPKRIEYELKYKNFDSFTMQITIPSVICPQCNKISGIDLDGSLNNHLNEAIIVAFKSENIKP